LHISIISPWGRIVNPAPALSGATAFTFSETRKKLKRKETQSAQSFRGAYFVLFPEFFAFSAAAG
jgi:hypothetical protein